MKKYWVALINNMVDILLDIIFVFIFLFLLDNWQIVDHPIINLGALFIISVIFILFFGYIIPEKICGKSLGKLIVDFLIPKPKTTPKAEAYNNKGNNFKNFKKYKDALRYSTKAIEIDCTFEEAYLNRGLLKEELKNYIGALEDYNKIIELNPQNNKVLILKEELIKKMNNS